MTAFKVASENPLDDLVVRVYHLDLSDCENFSEFKEIVQLMLANIDEVLKALRSYFSEDRRTARAAERLTLQATRLRELCAAVPETIDGQEDWREMAGHVIANYEQFRVLAGMLYQLAVPCSTFGVLKAAL
jgi:hypothetical protein